MSDLREVNAIHQAVTTDLQRRRELQRLSKPELIGMIRAYENGIADVTARIDHAYGTDP